MMDFVSSRSDFLESLDALELPLGGGGGCCCCCCCTWRAEALVLLLLLLLLLLSPFNLLHPSFNLLRLDVELAVVSKLWTLSAELLESLLFLRCKCRCECFSLFFSFSFSLSLSCSSLFFLSSFCFLSFC